jgi:hypothetical protein
MGFSGQLLAKIFKGMNETREKAAIKDMNTARLIILSLLRIIPSEIRGKVRMKRGLMSKDLSLGAPIHPPKSCGKIEIRLLSSLATARS